MPLAQSLGLDPEELRFVRIGNDQIGPSRIPDGRHNVPSPAGELPCGKVQPRVTCHLVPDRRSVLLRHCAASVSLRGCPDQSRVLETPHTAQGAATFKRTLDMRDDHPAKLILTDLCAIEVSTPHGQNLLRRLLSLPRQALAFNEIGLLTKRPRTAWREGALSPAPWATLASQPRATPSPRIRVSCAVPDSVTAGAAQVP